MGQIASHPLTDKIIYYEPYELKNQAVSTRQLPTQFFNCLGTMQGYRLTQEDSHLICNGKFSNSANANSVISKITKSDESNNAQKMNKNNDIFHKNEIQVKFRNPLNNDKYEVMWLSVFGVFDGHGGDKISKALSYKLNDSIWKTLEHHTYTKHSFRTVQGLLSQLFKDSFIKLDKEFFKTYKYSTQCGSTAVVCIIVNGKTIYCCNSGDSRALLSLKPTRASKLHSAHSNSTANEKHHHSSVATNLCCVKNLSFDHKPLHIGELMRINDNGGTVSLGRVNGVLALSRAFGDFQFKRHTYNHHKHKHGIPQEEQVTCEPDVLIHDINYEKDEFLVLACDGIWDVYSNKRLTQFIRYHLCLGLKLDAIVKKVLDHGIECADPETGCGFDNYSIIIVALNKENESVEEWYERMKMRLLRERRIS